MYLHPKIIQRTRRGQTPPAQITAPEVPLTYDSITDEATRLATFEQSAKAVNNRVAKPEKQPKSS